MLNIIYKKLDTFLSLIRLCGARFASDPSIWRDIHWMWMGFMMCCDSSFSIIVYIRCFVVVVVEIIRCCQWQQHAVGLNYETINWPFLFEKYMLLVFILYSFLQQIINNIHKAFRSFNSNIDKWLHKCLFIKVINCTLTIKWWILLGWKNNQTIS